MWAPQHLLMHPRRHLLWCFSSPIPSLRALRAWHALRGQSGHGCMSPWPSPCLGLHSLLVWTPRVRLEPEGRRRSGQRGSFSSSETGSSQNPGLPLAGRRHTPKSALPGPARDQKAVLSSRHSEEAEVGSQASQVPPPLWFFPNSSISSLDSGL